MPTGTPNPPPPSTIGPYPVERELGRGGMGVVYLARDPRLGRQVAIKVLPDAFTEDPVRLSRFEREARTLAAMNNRHIAMIFGLEQAASPESGAMQQLLVLEYVPGYSLNQRLSRGALPIDESLRMCVQIAEGLEAAHDAGVIHRDLKPDNVRVTPEGLVKVLDFGLATTSREGVLGETTTTGGSALTVQGMVMGTPGYMSPEQARGQPTDRRTDIWSFACVLFECLTGAKAFWGDTVTDALAAILDREPDYSLLPQRTPARVRDLLKRCLVKDPRRRLRDIGDARLEIEDVLTQPQSGWYKAADSGAGGAARSRLMARLTMPLFGPDAAPLALAPSPRSSIAVAPDASAVALVAGRSPAQIYVRRMDAPEARLIPGTQGADTPVFSPDSQRLAFFEGGRLKVVSLSGGLPMVLAPAPRNQGAAWAEDGNIYFIPEPGKGLFRIPANGGTPEQVASPDPVHSERAFLAPEILPGSRHALVTVLSGASVSDALITAIDLRSGQRRPLVHGGCNPRWSPTGHLVFSRAANLLAVAFDADRLDVFGQPVIVEQFVLAHAQGGGMQCAFGLDGTLVHAAGGLWQPGSDLLISEREATNPPRPLGIDRKPFVSLCASADSTKIAAHVAGASDEIWLFDAAQPAQTLSRLGAMEGLCPALSHDGRYLACRTVVGARTQIALQRTDIAGAHPTSVAIPSEFEDALLTPAGFCPRAAPPILAIAARRQTHSDAPTPNIVILAVNPDDPRSTRVIGEVDGAAHFVEVSPDGRFAAYAADLGGRSEVFVQPLADTSGAARKQASLDGGWCPSWSQTGGELYFRSPQASVAVRVAVEPTLMVGRPRVLATLPPESPSPRDTRTFLPLRDAQQFIMLRSSDDAPSVGVLNVAINWFEELRRRCPVPERVLTPPPARPSSYPASRPGMATQVTGDSAAMRANPSQ